MHPLFVKTRRRVLLKVIFLRDGGLGRCRWYVDKKLSNHYRATLGADFSTKEVQIDDSLFSLQCLPWLLQAPSPTRFSVQADDYLKTSCQTHAGFIENSMTGLPLTLKNITCREQIFQVRRDAYAGGARLTTFVINKIFDCALGGNTKNATASASLKKGATSSVSTISEGKKMTPTLAIKEKEKRVYKEVPDVPMGSNKRKLVLADEDTKYTI